MATDDEPIRIFITHLCRVDEEYGRVLEYLDGVRRLQYQLVSEPTAPMAATREMQRDLWRSQIQAAEVVVALSTQFDADPEAIEFQARFAKTAGKPVLLMRRFGSVLPAPVPLMRHADQAVDWNERALSDALKRHARGDSQARWDTIDFTLD
jgi:sugar/nucleoside kinase (ribokinase family)